MSQTAIAIAAAPVAAPGTAAPPPIASSTPGTPVPMTTTTLQASIRQALTRAPVVAAPAAPVALVPDPAAPAPGQGPSPEPPPAAITALPQTQPPAAATAPAPAAATPAPPAGEDPEEPTHGWPQSAVDAAIKARAQRRELRGELETSRKTNEELALRLTRLEQAVTGQPPSANGAPPLEVGRSTLDVQRSAPSPAPAGSHWASSHPQLAPIRQQEEAARGVAGWARAQLQRLAAGDTASVQAELAAQKINLPLDEPQAAQLWFETVRDNALANASDLRSDLKIAAAELRQGFSAERTRQSAAARTLMPELDKPDSPRAKAFAQVLEAHPALKDQPDGEYIAAVHVLGLEQAAEKLQASRNGSGSRPAPRPATTQLPNVTVLAPPPAPPAADASALFATFQKSGKPEDKEKWMKAVMHQQAA